MTHCFDLQGLKIRGVTFDDSLFWRGEGEGGSIYMKFFIQFLDSLGYADHFKRYFFYLYKNYDFYGMAELPPLFGKFHKNYYFFFETFP